MAPWKVTGLVSALVVGTSLAVAIAVYAGDGPRVGKPLGYSGARPALGHGVGQPLGSPAAQRPLGRPAGVRPLGGISNRRPLGTVGQQRPLGSARPQPPLGRLSTSQRPLGSTVNRHPLGHGRPLNTGSPRAVDVPGRHVNQALNQMRLQVGLRNRGQADSSIEPIEKVNPDPVGAALEQIRLRADLGPILRMIRTRADIESRVRTMLMLRDGQLRRAALLAQGGVIGARARTGVSSRASQLAQQQLHAVLERVQTNLLFGSLRPPVQGFVARENPEERQSEQGTGR